MYMVQKQATPKWECDACGDMHDDEDEAESCCIESCDHTDSEMASWGHAGQGSDFQMTCNNCGADGYGTFNSINWEHYDKTLEHEQTAETFEAQYGGTGAIMDIGKDTALDQFTDEELTTSSAIHGDFDQASLDYSGHQNIEVRAENKEPQITDNNDYVWETDKTWRMWYPKSGNWKEINTDYRKWRDDSTEDTQGGGRFWEDIGRSYEETYFVDMPSRKIYLVKFHFDVSGSKEACDWAERMLGLECDGLNHDKFNYDPANPQGHVYWVGHDKQGKEIPIFDAPYTHMEIIESDKKFKMAEMDIVADGMAVVSNVRDDVVGVVEVIDDEDDDELVEISIQDENMEEIGSYTLDDGMILDDEDNYLAESKTPSLLTLGIGAVAAILAFPYLKDGMSKVFGADNEVQEILENDPELIESPDTGDLDPAAYEELVVESTGYALDIIPMGLDGSFMGSRFAALPTERYVDYNDPGIGAHTDIALDRDEIYREPEQSMVQASETEVKETQAPGQSPYFQMGQEPADMNYRVIKETHPVSLDPAVKPFIPQSMAGYTGNKNTPPSVYNKMFNIGVLGQTPLFTPQDAGDIGASRAGSRRATPDVLGLNGSVGGPLSDKVNANYTDGTTSMSLAQWAQENTVSQSSDTEAVVIDRSSGAMKRVRRV